MTEKMLKFVKVDKETPNKRKASNRLDDFREIYDEFILAFFLSSSDQTLPLYMWGQLRFPKKLPHVLALGAVIIVVTSLIVILSYWLRNIGNPASKKSNIGGI